MSHVVVEILKALFTVAAFACAWCEVRLLVTPMNRAIKLSLMAFTAMMLVPLAYLYLNLSFPSAAARLVPLQRISLWLYGPFLIAFMHALLHVPVSRKRTAFYFGPALIVAFVRPLGASSNLGVAWELLGLAQATGFAIVAIVWALRRAGQLRILVTAFSNSALNWVIYLCAGLLALLVLDFYIHSLLLIDRPPSPTLFYALTAPCALYAISVSLALVWKMGSAPPLGPELVAETIDTSAPSDATEPASRKLELTPSAAGELQEQLAALLRDKKIHTRNDLSLADLAALLSISTHIASELLNQHLGKSFYEFLNAHRAAEAAMLLADETQNLSMTDVAYEAGFNNPNTFYREFKRHHGMTPTQYRKSHRPRAPQLGGFAPNS
jgi:AraC-like DNA-binding protein